MSDLNYSNQLEIKENIEHEISTYQDILNTQNLLVKLNPIFLIDIHNKYNTKLSVEQRKHLESIIEKITPQDIRKYLEIKYKEKINPSFSLEDSLYFNSNKYEKIILDLNLQEFKPFSNNSIEMKRKYALFIQSFTFDSSNENVLRESHFFSSKSPEKRSTFGEYFYIDEFIKHDEIYSNLSFLNKSKIKLDSKQLVQNFFSSDYKVSCIASGKEGILIRLKRTAESIKKKYNQNIPFVTARKISSNSFHEFLVLYLKQNNSKNVINLEKSFGFFEDQLINNDWIQDHYSLNELNMHSIEFEKLEVLYRLKNRIISNDLKTRTNIFSNLFDFYKEEIRNVYQEPIISLEYIPGKTLEQLINDEKEHEFLNKNILDYGYHILNGIHELRNNNIMHHRDIKPKNIIINSKSNRPVIIDLGVATFYADPKLDSDFNVDGYDDPNKFNKAYGCQDLVSLGQIMYKMTTKKNLFVDSKTLEDTTLKYEIRDERNKLYANYDFLINKYHKKIDQTINDDKIKYIIKELLNPKYNDANITDIIHLKNIFTTN